MKKLSLIKLTLILSGVLYLAVKLTPIWSRTFLSAWSNYIIVTGLIIWFVILLLILSSIIQLFRKSNYSRPSSYLSIIFTTILLLDVYYNPLNIDLESLYAKIKYKAHYEGSMSSATFTLRDNDKFEIKYTSAPFNQTYWKGKYTLIGDTLLLDFLDSEPPFEWGNKVIKVDGKGIVVSNKNNKFNPKMRPFFWEIEGSN